MVINLHTVLISCLILLANSLGSLYHKAIMTFPNAKRIKVDDVNENQSLQDRLQDQRKSKKFCDITLQAENEEFPCHKNVLAAYSDYFFKMFSIDMKEKHSKTIMIKNVTAKAMKEVLNCIYTGTFELSEESLNEILYAASLMQVDVMLKKCGNYMEEILTNSNCFFISCLAETYSLVGLAETVEINLMDEYMFASHPCHPCILQFGFDQIESILASKEVEVPDEKQVFDFIVDWVNYHPKERKEYFLRLFQLVRLQFISVEDLKESVLQNPLVKEVKECCDLIASACAFHASPSIYAAQDPRDCYIREADTVMLLPYEKSYHTVYIDEAGSKRWQKLRFHGLTDDTVLKGCGVAVCSEKSQVMVCGGIKENQTSAQVLRFDSVRWLPMESLQEARCGAACVFHKDTLFVFGGETSPISTSADSANTQSSGGFSTTFEKHSSKWKRFEFPFKRSYFAAVSTNECIYLIGGYTLKHHDDNIAGNQETVCKEVCNDCIAYFPTSNTFEKVAGLNHARACFGCEKFWYDIIVVGGIGLNGSHLKSIEYKNCQDKSSVWTTFFWDELPIYSQLNSPLSTYLNGHTLYVGVSSHPLLFRSYLCRDDGGLEDWSVENPIITDDGLLVPFSRWYSDEQKYTKVMKLE